MRLIKIFLLLTIIVFFLPFFSVSCNPQDKGISFSGFEFTTGKNINGHQQNGKPFGFILIIAPVILLILSFFIYKTKNNTVYNIYKYILFIAPIFDIFAVFIVKHAFEIIAKNKFGEIPVLIKIKYGFILYIIFNAAVFIFAVMNYFISPLNQSPHRPPQI